MRYFLGVDNLKFFRKWKKYIFSYFSFNSFPVVIFHVLHFFYVLYFFSILIFFLHIMFGHITSLLLLALNLCYFLCLGCSSRTLPLCYGSIVVSLSIWKSYLKHHISNSLFKLSILQKLCLLKYLNESTLPLIYIYVIYRHTLLNRYYLCEWQRQDTS